MTMNPHRILKSFKGSQNGVDSHEFEAGTVANLSDWLAEVAVKEGWAELIAEQEATPAAATQGNPPEAEKYLMGSSIQPSTWELPGGESLQLGAVVAEAHRRSGLTVDEWNSADREGAIQAVVDELVPLAPEIAGELQPRELLEGASLEEGEHPEDCAVEVGEPVNPAELSEAKAEEPAEENKALSAPENKSRGRKKQS